MKLYKFELRKRADTKIVSTVVEAEEKPKTYCIINGHWRSRLNKSDIGKVTGCLSGEVYLLSWNPESAKSAFEDYYKNKIKEEEEQIQKHKKRISDYEKLIAEISEIKNVEESED